MKIVIGSEPTRDELFAEIQDNEHQPWAEITIDVSTKRPMLTIYPRHDEVPHLFDFAEAEAALMDAKNELIRRGYQFD